MACAVIDDQIVIISDQPYMCIWGQRESDWLYRGSVFSQARTRGYDDGWGKGYGKWNGKSRPLKRVEIFSPVVRRFNDFARCAINPVLILMRCKEAS